ncbi:MAG: SAM-dependent methyltransferase [Gemmatimonadetes bacterium]|nr:SAM-dependent methyltransferase [Gemmatimonadota bacterium]|tara:strand:+ start:58697 stop:59545 length:849 start_codon:yes stop_codon:yes gene_type:complete
MDNSTFSRNWLQLRESADHRSRSHALASALMDFWDSKQRVNILDLGSGTGSNLRYLSKYLGDLNQRWTLLDKDESLLDNIKKPSMKSVNFVPVVGDILDEGLQLVQGSDLVTGSALLDLTSEKWLHKLAQSVAHQGCPAYFALSYTGNISWLSNDNLKSNHSNPKNHEFICDLVNQHQRRDKGTGPALGPLAVIRLDELLRGRGYITKCHPSHWILGHEDSSLKKALIENWSHSAIEECPDEKKKILSWRHSCLSLADSTDGILEVSHLDILALPKLRSVNS